MMFIDSGEHVKTVYAHFGSAIYFAQCLEHGLVNALVYLKLIPERAHAIQNPDEWASTVDAFMDRHFEQTLGQMLKQLSSVTEVPEDLAEILDLALRRRNWLAHDYFRERASEFMNASGRDRMISELEETEKLFRDADVRLDAAFKSIRIKYGFTDERLRQACDEMLSEVTGDL